MENLASHHSPMLQRISFVLAAALVILGGWQLLWVEGNEAIDSGARTAAVASQNLCIATFLGSDQSEDERRKMDDCVFEHYDKAYEGIEGKTYRLPTAQITLLAGLALVGVRALDWSLSRPRET